MQTKFFLDRSIGNWSAIIFLICVSLMAGAAALTGRFFVTLHITALMYATVFLIWYALIYGIFVTIEGESLRVTRFFLRGKLTPLSDVISIQKRDIFAGFMTEVYMKVREPDGTFYEQGLLNKPGLSESEYKRLFDAILTINPNIEIDHNLLRK
jgi:hypothetical protein